MIGITIDIQHDSAVLRKKVETTIKAHLQRAWVIMSLVEQDRSRASGASGSCRI
jgi:hypothetical protein